MIAVQKNRKRMHFEPQPRADNIDTALRDQKDELILILTDYIEKRKTKDETVAGLSNIETACNVCNDCSNPCDIKLK
jgi:hypothetical protein